MIHVGLYEVANGDTRQGYIAWVNAALEHEVNDEGGE